MYINFDFVCSLFEQTMLYGRVWKRVSEWLESGVVRRVILTYHQMGHGDPPSLYVCLDIPSVEEPLERRLKISEETKDQIPSDIMDYFNSLAHEFKIAPQIIDYSTQLQHTKRYLEKKSKQPYWNGLPIPEIMECQAVGTETAIEVLRSFEQDEHMFENNIELRDFLIGKMEARLGANYARVKDHVWDVVCNSLTLWGFAEDILSDEAYDRWIPQRVRALFLESAMC